MASLETAFSNLRTSDRYIDRFLFRSGLVAGSSKKIEKIEAIGFFSLDRHANFHPDHRSVRQVTPIIELGQEKRVNIDLNRGIELIHSYATVEGDISPGFEKLLRWILLNGKELNHPTEKMRLSVNIVAARRVIKAILVLPFMRSGGKIFVERFKGTLYFKEEDYDKDTDGEIHAPISCPINWGMKFETYVTGQNPDEELDFVSELYGVYSSEIGGRKLLYSAVVDGVEGDFDEKNPRKNIEKLVQFKTCPQFYLKNCDKLYREKYLNWWSQNELSGIRKILCGFRDGKGFVDRIKAIDVSSMPYLNVSCRPEERWEPKVMWQQLDLFLCWLDEIVVEENAVYELHLPQGERGVPMVKVARKDDRSFLPSWYTENVFAPTESNAPGHGQENKTGRGEENKTGRGEENKTGRGEENKTGRGEEKQEILLNHRRKNRNNRRKKTRNPAKLP